MPSFILTDCANDVATDRFTTSGAALGIGGPGWSVHKQTLAGGRRAGVELVEVNNGTLVFWVIPTRGMGIWKARLGSDHIGWKSPVADGPVNPAFVNLATWGGLGWLGGFDELLVRCGLEQNGAPYGEKAVQADGSERHTTHGLHGRIANIPAHYVAVHVGEAPPHEIVIEGHVDEALLFGPRLRMITRISTVPGSNRLTVRDEIQNLKDTPGDLELLYHWNFGPPHLEEGSRFVAPMKTVVPRDPRAREGIGHFEVFGPPEPGYAEQVYFFELAGEGPNGQTLAMLQNRAGDKAVALRFSLSQLPAFTLWKNTGGMSDGYVTGLEPATNYPNPKPFEKKRNRVIALVPGARHVAETTLEVLAGRSAVESVAAEIKKLQAQATPTVHKSPVEPFAPEA